MRRMEFDDWRGGRAGASEATVGDASDATPDDGADDGTAIDLPEMVAAPGSPGGRVGACRESVPLRRTRRPWRRLRLSITTISPG